MHQMEGLIATDDLPRTHVTTPQPQPNLTRIAVMATFFARFTIPRPNGSLLSLFGRTVRVSGVIGTTGAFGAHILSKPAFPRTLAQGPSITHIPGSRGLTWIGGVAPRTQFTQRDTTLRVSRSPIDPQQLSSGSMTGIILGYLTAKIGQLFLFTFSGVFLFAAV
jgi:hypothetical protein